MNITSVAPSVDMSSQVPLSSARARDTRLLVNGINIVDIATVRREHLNIYVNLAEVNHQQCRRFQLLPASAIDQDSR